MINDYKKFLNFALGQPHHAWFLGICAQLRANGELFLS